MLWNTFPDVIKSAKNDRQFKQNQRLDGILMLLFNLYISIVNRKITWPVLVLNYFFLANFKDMYYYYYYYSLILNLKHTHSDVKFVNLSMSTIGIMGKSSESLLIMLDNFNLDTPIQHYVIRKVMKIAIRCTYYFFCCRNKPWSYPDLLDF